MKNKFYFIIPILFFFICCNENNSSNKTVSDSADSSAVSNNKIPEPNREMISIDSVNSTFECTRSKTVKDVDQEIVILGKAMNVKMDNASFSASVAIKINKANWIFVDHKFEEGIIVLDMKSVSTMQVGKNKSLEMSNPDYLDVEKYPTATLYILKYDSIPGNKKEMNISARLQLKDSTANIDFPAKIAFEKFGENIAPSKFTGDFHIDGIKWRLNRKNAKVSKDDLLFHVVLITKEK